MKKTNDFVKNSLARVKSKRYHYVHGKQAKLALSNIVKNKPNLDPKLYKRCEEYAHDVLGWTGYSPWLKVYTAFNGEFREGWIPDNYYGHIVVPKIQGDYGKLSFLNMLSNAFFGVSSFPDLVYHINGNFFSGDKEVIICQSVKDFLFKEQKKVVFKQDNSFQGNGLHIYQKTNFNIKEILKLGNGVFQAFISAHPDLKKYSPTATATLRITTVQNQILQSSFRCAYLRFGRSNENYVSSNSQIRVGITSTGEFFSDGHLSNFGSISSHPDTKELFNNGVVPYFKKAVTLCLELHDKIKYISCIGWDVTVDAEGEIHILEWNGYHNDIKYSEMTQGPCFADLGWEHLWKENETNS